MAKVIKNDPRQYRTRSVVASGQRKVTPEMQPAQTYVDRLAGATFDKRWYVQLLPTKR